MPVNAIVDIVLVLILLFGFFFGIKRGFVKTVAKPIKIIAAFAIAFLLAAPVGEIFVSPIVSEPITNKLTGILTERTAGLAASEISDGVPTLLKFAAGLCGVSVEEVATGNTTDEIVLSLTEALVSPVIQIVSSIVAFVLLYIASRILLRLLLSIVDSIVDGGAVGAINKLLGCVFGVTFAFAAAWALVAVFDFVVYVPAVQDMDWVSEFNGGYVYNFFKSVSPLDLLLSF